MLVKEHWNSGKGQGLLVKLDNHETGTSTVTVVHAAKLPSARHITGGPVVVIVKAAANSRGKVNGIAKVEDGRVTYPAEGWPLFLSKYTQISPLPF
jgi:hypothetical protein